MLKRIWLKIKNMFTRVCRIIAPIVKPSLRFLGVLGILIIGWYAFLSIVPHPPIDTTPALIMVWSSIVILLIALFPKIFDRIKRFKVKDFEIELQDTVAKSTPEDFLSIADMDEYTFSQKGSFRNLEEIIEQSIRQPSKPVLLTANLRDGEYISIPMLFVYLFFLDIIGKSVTVLFISTLQGLRDIGDIAKDSIVGVVSGKTVLQTFYRRFPHLSRIFDMHLFAESPHGFEELFRRGRFRSAPAEFIFRKAYNNIVDSHSNEQEFISERDVRNWFKGELNERTVEVNLGSHDLKTIREALAQGDEFILSIKDKSLRSVISLCYFSKSLSKKVLADMAESK